jgi:type IV pilus assembly protein PilV
MSVKEHHQGFTLIEVLIAIVIFSIGLLGIASLQIAGMRFTHGSQLRSVATLQAESIVDLMRANTFGVRNGFYNKAVTGMPTNFTTDCSTATCNAQDRATFDLVTWNQSTTGQPRQANDEVLPQGTGIVCRDSTPDDGDATGWDCDNLGNVYAVKIQWQERAVGAEDTGQTDVHDQVFVMSVLPALDEN